MEGCGAPPGPTPPGPTPSDTTAPDTRLDSASDGNGAPFAGGAIIATDSATFTFSGDPAADTAKLQCAGDGGPFVDCGSSPLTLTGLSNGPHTVFFRAVDAVGNEDLTPAQISFTVAAATGPEQALARTP